MSRRPRRVTAAAIEPSASTPERTPWSLLDLLALALVVARWFTPTEGTFRGDTIWIAQLWLGWGVLASWSAVRNGDRWRRRWTGLDAGLLLLLAGHVIATLVVCFTTGQKRAALYGMWEWVSIAIAGLWLFDRARDRVFRQSFQIALIGSAVALASLGVWQRWVWQPSISAAILEFDRIEKELPTLEGGERSRAESRLRRLRESVGSEYPSLDDAGRRAMRQRVIESSEPIGRFALANTFAALLAVGLLLCVGYLRAMLPRRGPAAFLGLCGTLLAFVLLLTKSRTAWVGSICGGVVAAVLSSRGRTRQVLTGSLLVAGITAVLVIATWMIGGIDAPVLSQAPKSLAYRIEYWQGSWGVIQEHPFVGVGPGNFRQHYLGHKLAKSSEEILDPHNLFLDAWATGGLLSLIGLIVLASVGAKRLLTAGQGSGNENASVDAGALAPLAVFAAGLLTFGKESLLDGGDDGSLLATIAVAVTVTGVLARICNVRATQSNNETGNTVQTAIVAAWVALSVHLLGAGGMEMPAVFQLWLSLLTLIVVRPDSSTIVVTDGHSRSHWPAIATGVALSLFVAQLLTTTSPWLGAKADIGLAEADMLSQGPSPKVDERLQDAALHDRLDPEPWRRRAQNALALWDRNHAEEWFDRAVASQREAISRDPINPHDYRGLAEIFLRRVAFDHRAADAQAAVGALEESLKRYPNQIPARRLLADALSAAGRTAEAATAAKSALELDALYLKLEHHDKTLTEEQRTVLRRIENAPGSGPGR